MPAARGRGVVGVVMRTEFARLCSLRGGGDFVRGRNDSWIGNREIGSETVLVFMRESTKDARVLLILLGDLGGMDSGLDPEAVLGQQRITIWEAREIGEWDSAAEDPGMETTALKSKDKIRGTFWSEPEEPSGTCSGTSGS